MDASHQARIEQLEVLYSEQDYTVQTLNATIAQQEREILRLSERVERLSEQLRSISKGLGDDIDQEFEKPPHY